MRFSPQFLEDIRARLAVSDVVGRKVKLQRRGREFVGLSPFNPEKTPSFTVNDQKGFYHCFSSGQHGDIFSFVMETEGLSFTETVERLASEAGLELPKADPRAEERARESRGLNEVLELAAKFFEARLQSTSGAAARGYLADRGITDRARQAFRIGYATSGRFELKNYLAEQGISPDDMALTGLVISGDDIPVAYDRFRDRVMFPITDMRGRMVGFGGRALSADAPAKYLNSPETPVFHKGSILYNAQTARQSAHEKGSVIVVEGYMDVIAMAMADYNNVVAPLGTALTEDQLHLLWRMEDEPILCFDGDRAGVKAAYRAIDLALPLLKPGKSLRFALLPEGQDPDDLIRDEGAGAIEAVLQRAEPMIDILWQRETSGQKLDTPERRAAFEERLRGILRDISESGVRRHYGHAIADRLRNLWGQENGRASDSGRYRQGAQRQFRGRGKKGMLQGTAIPRGNALLAGPGKRITHREACILVALVNRPELIESFLDEIAGLALANQQLDSLRTSLLDIAAQDDLRDGQSIRAELGERSFGDFLEELKSIVEDTGSGFAQSDATDSAARAGLKQAIFLHNKTLTLHKELLEAERALAEEDSEESLDRLRDIQAQLQNVESVEALSEDQQDLV